MTQGQPTILQTVARHCLSLQAVNPTLYRDLEPLGSVSSHAQGLRDDKEQPPCHPQDLVTRGRIERARRPRCPQQRVGRPRALHPPVVTSGHSTAQAIMYVPSLGSLDDDDGTKLVFVRVRVRVRRNVREQASSSEALHSGRFLLWRARQHPRPLFQYTDRLSVTAAQISSDQLSSAQLQGRDCARRSILFGPVRFSWNNLSEK
ncbi:hypothetical protein BDV95DRAFT_559670 [Massariosphaeria phaeospora]|uniref:Uncharacterized protein n=1 Tax=Massariosphaeria phaeospora TaxID=100035 RepID=A0A7C8MHF3_9PLEO|nr:hypothetical protein BDV95DRAFT_559670 [Massariosphaeria phaeospora]